MWPIVLVCAALAIETGCGTAAYTQTAPREKRKMANTSSYPVLFASPRRDSALGVGTSVAGKVAWSGELGAASSPDWPPAVLTWGDRVAVATYSDIEVLDPRGARIWSVAKQGGTPAVVADGRLYFKGRNLFLQARNPAGEVVLTDAPFPGGMSGAVKVNLFWPRDRDFVAVLYSPPEDTADGDPPGSAPRALTTLVRNRYETTYGDWIEEYPGRSQLAPLLVPESNVVTVFIGEAIRVDVEAGKEVSRFRIPLEERVEWSVDAAGVYCVTGYRGGRKVVVGISAEGKGLWQWTDSEESDRWSARQPPIGSAGGRVFVLTEGRVLAFEKGKLLWQFDAMSDSLRHGASVDDGTFKIEGGRLRAIGGLRHGSALSDGSLLVTRNRTLYHLDRDGRKIFAVAVDQDIMSPPVVDAEGSIYVATASRLYQIR